MAADAPRRGRRALEAAAVAVGFFGLACLLYWPVAPLDGSHIVSTAGSDPAQEVWFLAWTPFALLHGLDPFHTTYLNARAGANLSVNTTMPALGVVGLPVTELLGPIATYNLLLRLGLALSGASMFAVLRRYTAWWPAALGGALVYAFSSFMVGHAYRHLFLVFVPIPPLVVLLVDDWLVRPRRPPVRSGLLLGGLLLVQYLVSPEVCALTLLFTAMGLAALTLRYGRRARERVRSAVVGAAVAGGVLAAGLAYPLWMMFAGPGHVIGPPHALSDLARYHGDLLAPIVPTSTELLAPRALARVGSGFVAGSLEENGFYLGLPLVLLSLFLVVRCRRVGIVVVGALTAAAAFVLGLGQRLWVDGHGVASPMPFSVVARLPALQSIEPARCSLFLQLGVAFVFAVGLDRVRAEGWWPPPSGASRTQEASGAPRAPGERLEANEAEHPSRPSWRHALGVLAVGAVAVVPLVPGRPIPSSRVRVPRLFASARLSSRYLAHGAVALTFPFDKSPVNEAMIWQAVSGMAFRLVGGDVFVQGRHGHAIYHLNPAGAPEVDRLLLAGGRGSIGPPPSGPAVVVDLRRMLERQRIQLVLVRWTARDGPIVARAFRLAIGAPPVQVGAMDLWPAVEQQLARSRTGHS